MSAPSTQNSTSVQTPAGTSAALIIDGLPQGFANYGAARSDVCAVFSGRGGCSNVGWYSTVDTTQFQNGSNLIGLIITSSQGHVLTITRGIETTN